MSGQYLFINIGRSNRGNYNKMGNSLFGLSQGLSAKNVHQSKTDWESSTMNFQMNDCLPDGFPEQSSTCFVYMISLSI